jgi:uncharacterized membrane protein YdjX (TVP38/TMEM64 family)
VSHWNAVLWDGPGWISLRACMELLKRILSDRRFHRLAGVGLLLAGAGVLAAWRLGVDVAALKEWWTRAEIFLRERPWWLFAALVILPGLPVPTSALLVLAGTVWSARPVAACAICLLAIALNMCWTYWLAARPGRGLVERMLSTGRLRIPVLPKDNHLRAILLLRLTPGVPLFLQNYLLGFLHVPFRFYLPVSLACTGLMASGIVLSGAGVAGGNFAPALTGAGLIIVAVVLVRILRQKLAGRG